MPQSTTLFVAPPTIDPRDYLPSTEKTADIRLSSPPMHWVDEVTQALIQAHPYIPPDQIIVNFKQKDDAAGYAIGFITIQGAPRASIPVIISQRRLKPLDILIVREDGDPNSDEAVGNFTDDRVMPLTEETFGQAMDSGEPGENLNPQELRHSLGWSESAHALRLPYRGRTAIASLAAVVGASESKKAEFQEVLENHREIVAGFASSPLGQAVLTSWLEAPPCSQDIQHKLASQQVSPAVARFVEALPAEQKTADFLGAEIVTEDGTIKTAVAFDAVDLANPVEMNRFLIFEDGSYVRAPEKVACATSGCEQDVMVRRVLEKVASTGLSRGDTISLQLDGVFTAPAKIASIMHDREANSLTLELISGLGAKYPLLLTPTVKSATLTDQGTWVVPVTNTVLKLGSYAQDRKRPMPVDKVASQVRSSFPDTLVCAGSQFTLTIAGEDFGINQANEAKCAAVLNTWFENGQELLSRVKEAASANPDGSGCVRFDSDLRSTVQDVAEKIASFRQYPEVAQEWIDRIALPLEKAAALASSLSDPEGADAVLSTGFLSEDNLSEFSGLAEEFREVVEKLARLLLLLRMGHQEGDEAATLVAMKSLQRVAESLRGMGNMPEDSGLSG